MPANNSRKKSPAEMNYAWGSYKSMLSRCYCPSMTGYEKYGGRGITVCERWRQGFKFFLEDMGARRLCYGLGP